MRKENNDDKFFRTIVGKLRRLKRKADSDSLSNRLVSSSNCINRINTCTRTGNLNKKKQTVYQYGLQERK